jgi:uncharacterized protein YggL (DUF469 family)
VDSREPLVKKRLRKKKHLGEFKVLGFKVRGDLRPGLSGNDIEAFVDRLIDVVEARSLAFGGGAGRDDKLDGFVTYCSGKCDRIGSSLVVSSEHECRFTG